MPGMKARIQSRRADGAPPPEPLSEEADQPTAVVPTTPAPDESPSQPAGPEVPAEPATAVIPVVAEAAPEPDVEAGDAVGAGADPAPPTGPSFRDRGRLRRRLRYLRRIRELGFRDLGGLVFDLDRFGRERQDLVRAKLDALAAIDRELRTLEVALDDVRPLEELEEPGIASCRACGALHGSEARFCPSCGTPVDGVPPAPVLELGAVAPEQPAA
jgi:hypothetical protein